MKNLKDQKVKLTLSVKKSAIDEAKKYASLEGSSLSNIVEDFLVKYSKSNPDSSHYNLPDELFGCAKNGSFNELSDKEIRNMRIKDRYNL
jgi:hypothetical protein